MTQTHKIYLKWIEGAGTQNIPSWSVFTLIDSDETFDQVRGGVPTDVQRLNISVPAALSIPTADSGLTAPTATYNIGAAGGLYKFTGMAGAGGASSSTSVIIHSVVIMRPATDAAACKAVRVTFAGSGSPNASMSPYSPLAAL